jgi:hypothetical protein
MQILLELINGVSGARWAEMLPRGSSFCNQNIYCGNPVAAERALWLYAVITFLPNVVQLFDVETHY